MQWKTLVYLGLAMFTFGAITSVVRHLMNAPLYEPGMVRQGFGTVYPAARASTTSQQQPLQENLEKEAEEAEPIADCHGQGQQKIHFSTWQMEEGIEIAWFSQGKRGGQPVLVLHGGPGIPPVLPWPFSDALLDQYQFYYYHQRGCGYSTIPFDRFDPKISFYDFMHTLDSTLGIAPQLADIERIRQIITSPSSPSPPNSSLPFGGQKIILIGHSFGAFLASLYAAEFPENVEALVLMTPADVIRLPSPHGGGLFEDVKAKLPQEQRAAYEDFVRRYLDFSALKSASESELVDLHMEFLDYYRRVSVPMPPLLKELMGKPGGWVTYALYLSMGRVHDFSEALKHISAPALIVHGEQDLQSVAASASYNIIPRAQLVVLPNASHFPHLEDPLGLSSLLDLFLQQHQIHE